MKKIIRLTEGELHHIIENSVKRVLKEEFNRRGKFDIVGELPNPVDVNNLQNTLHAKNDRNDRLNRIKSQIGSGEPVVSFVVDTGHPNGNEIHTILNNGVIVIQNERTKKLITSLIARPGQIKRYWNNQGKRVPEDLTYLLDIARNHQQQGMNGW